MTPVTIRTSTRPITLPDLDQLPPHLRAKFTHNPPAWWTQTEGTK